MRKLQERKTPACTATARPRVLLLCSPCMGHLIPFAELARRIVADHGLAATLLFASATSPPSEQYLAVAAAVPDAIDLVVLPAPPPDALPPTATMRDRAELAVVSNVPRVREIARELGAAAPLVALVVDMVAALARDVATELGVPFYTFFTSPWMTLSLFLHLPEIDAARAGEYRDATEPIRLPGCVPIHAQELPASMLADRSSNTYAGFLSMAKDVAGVDGILVNTFHDLESVVDDGLQLPVYPVGPLVWTRPPAGVDMDHKCMSWLDQQPRGSVVYVSFGSGGTLTWQQTAELALGLELSQCRFLWAVKRPHQSSTAAAFFGTQKGDQQVPLDFLPEGFMERTRGIGLLLVQSWAPQTAILGHPSVGCFVTHCGWNSVLESVINGVPMVAWPLYAEQSMNAAMMEVQVGVAVRAKVGADRFTKKEEVANAIRRAMVGEEAERLRKRSSELRVQSVHALSKDGCSTRVLAQIANTWKCHPRK